MLCTHVIGERKLSCGINLLAFSLILYFAITFGFLIFARIPLQLALTVSTANPPVVVTTPLNIGTCWNLLEHPILSDESSDKGPKGHDTYPRPDKCCYLSDSLGFRQNRQGLKRKRLCLKVSAWMLEALRKSLIAANPKTLA